MFTLPVLRQAVGSSDVTQSMNRTIEDTHIALSKQRFRCMRWTIVFVPLALTFVAVHTRLRVHPAFLDLLLADGEHEWTEWTKVIDWSRHEPHSVASSPARRYTLNHPMERDTTSPTPTVPVDPSLPNPFPQAFDTTLSANFTTTSCHDFFLNLTQSDAFSSCRPFSLLSSTSYAFSQAQDDINLMNTVIWATCNTDPSQEQCDANMSWFASSLQSSCQMDLSNQVETAVLALNALYAYDLMRNSSCAVDVSTNAYCYVEAVANPDPSILGFYLLPLGRPLGLNITFSGCSACTANLISSYTSALSGTNAGTLSGLEHTYDAAVEMFNGECGTTYAKVTQVSKVGSAWVNVGVPRMAPLIAWTVLVVFVGVLCGS